MATYSIVGDLRLTGVPIEIRCDFGTHGYVVPASGQLEALLRSAYGKGVQDAIGWKGKVADLRNDHATDKVTIEVRPAT